MLWMLCGASYALSIASASVLSPFTGESEGAAQWGYQPFQTTAPASVYTRSYGSTTYGNATTGTTGTSFLGASKPAYQFQTTSAYINPLNTGSHSIMTEHVTLMRSEGWGNIDDDDDENPPIGTTTPTPVGDPMVLLVCAILFVCVQYYRSRFENRHIS